MVYKFFGAQSEVGGAVLNRLGQSIRLPDKRGEEAVMGAGPLAGYAGSIAVLPEDVFDKIFSDEDIEQFGNPYAREKAPFEFKAKIKAAYEAQAELRAKYEKEAAREAAAKEAVKEAAAKEAAKAALKQEGKK